MRETMVSDEVKKTKVQALEVGKMNIQDKLEKLVHDIERSRLEKRVNRREEGAKPKQIHPGQPDYDLGELREDVDQLLEAAAGHVELYERFLEYKYDDDFDDEDNDEGNDPFAHHVGIKLIACNYDITYNYENGEPMGKPAYYWRIAAYKKEWLLFEYNYETLKTESMRYKKKGNLLNHLLRQVAPLMCD